MAQEYSTDGNGELSVDPAADPSRGIDPARSPDSYEAVLESVGALLRWEEDLGGLDALEAVVGARPAQPRGSSAHSASHGAAPELGSSRAADMDGPMTRSLAILEQEARECTRCALHEGRTKSVFARGAETARVMFIGEGPGFHEDQQGVPFVGRAGQLLDKMIAAMGLSEADYYICNVVKCRPPENRTPLPPEAAACEPYLQGQIQNVRPEVIVALGRCAAENLECMAEGDRGWRGRWAQYRNIPVMATYHPAFLLRNEKMKRPVWEDLQQVMARLNASSKLS